MSLGMSNGMSDSTSGGFSADWLALREPADHRSRSLDLTATIAARLQGRDTATVRERRTIVDLGSGTGSNIRFLAPRLGVSQDWVACDADERLLVTLTARMARQAHESRGRVAIETRLVDLAALVEGAEGTPGAALPTTAAPPALVTASALLDLVSAAWVTRLVADAATAGADLLFVLSYDGRITIAPDAPDDAFIRALVNQHQQTDKGFGPALGPRATDVAATAAAAEGYEVQRAPSDWVLDADERQLQGELIGGWAQAAHELSADRARIDRWTEQRLAQALLGQLTVTVGHEDLAAWRP